MQLYSIPRCLAARIPSTSKLQHFHWGSPLSQSRDTHGLRCVASEVMAVVKAWLPVPQNGAESGDRAFKD